MTVIEKIYAITTTGGILALAGYATCAEITAYRELLITVCFCPVINFILIYSIFSIGDIIHEISKKKYKSKTPETCEAEGKGTEGSIKRAECL